MAALLPQIVRVEHYVTAGRKLHACGIPVGSPLMVARIVVDLIVDIRRALAPSVFDVTLQAQPLPPFMKEILDAGGLMPWVARRMKEGGDSPKVTVPANEPPQADWRLD